MSFNEGNTLVCTLFFIVYTLDSSYSQEGVIIQIPIPSSYHIIRLLLQDTPLLILRLPANTAPHATSYIVARQSAYLISRSCR